TLRSSAEFSRVLHGGRRAGARGVVVCALPARVAGRQATESVSTRMGVVVRAPNQAVVRNRIKRRIRAAFVACDPAVGYDVVIRADERAESMSFTDLTGALNGALTVCGVPTGERGASR
ncbi:MAG: ribonuclease P protein component, partial [Actinomycetota bacterium]|nr:ribonuclease P protein component [Actinomycetota bacterium]